MRGLKSASLLQSNPAWEGNRLVTSDQLFVWAGGAVFAIKTSLLGLSIVEVADV
jgi:hypothetical protein